MRHVLDLKDSAGRPLPVEVLIHPETVELRCRDFRAGIADRVGLRRWLSDPAGDYCFDDVTWLHLGSGHRVALCIGDVICAHVLEGPAVADLCSYL